jgi:hypothetical protein
MHGAWTYLCANSAHGGKEGVGQCILGSYSVLWEESQHLPEEVQRIRRCPGVPAQGPGETHGCITQAGHTVSPCSLVPAYLGHQSSSNQTVCSELRVSSRNTWPRGRGAWFPRFPQGSVAPESAQDHRMGKLSSVTAGLDAGKQTRLSRASAGHTHLLCSGAVERVRRWRAHNSEDHVQLVLFQLPPPRRLQVCRKHKDRGAQQ